MVASGVRRKAAPLTVTTNTIEQRRRHSLWGPTENGAFVRHARRCLNSGDSEYVNRSRSEN